MKGIDIEVPIKGSRLELIPLGDVHYGSRYCSFDVFKEWVNYISKQRDTRVILMGDLLESATVQFAPPGAVFEQTKTVQEQFDDMLEVLKPIKKQILGSVTSNHEYRFYKLGGFDITKTFCDTLGIDYFGEALFVTLHIGKQSYKVYALHGANNATTRAGKFSSLLRLSPCLDADILIQGHVHTKDVYEITSLTLEKTRRSMVMAPGIYKKKKVLVLSGGFLEYGGYAALRGLPPETIGCPKIELYGDKDDIHVKV